MEIELPVVASLTTSPTRIHKMYSTLKSIVSQSRPPDRVILNIPYMFKKTGERYTIPRFMEEFPTVYINWVEEDMGPVTKLVPTLALMKKDAYIWIVDDDQDYLRGELAYMLSKAEKTKIPTVYCLSGIHSDGMDMRIASKNCILDVFEAYAGVLVRKSMFEDDFSEYISRCIKHDVCRISDDLMVSMYLKEKGVDIERVGGVFVNLWLHWNLGGVLEYGNGPDALHNSTIAKSTIERYKKALPVLYEILNEVCR